MREAGFEPANPKDVGLSDVALTTNRFARNHIFYFFLFFWRGAPPSIHIPCCFFKLFIIVQASQRSCEHMRYNRRTCENGMEICCVVSVPSSILYPP